MADIEKVIATVEDVRNYCFKRYHEATDKQDSNDWLDWSNALSDALELLKEYAVIKETISDGIHETAKMFRRTEEDGWIERCDRRARQSLSG